jgi:hypothetical protein
MKKKILKLAGHLVFNSGSNESRLAPQFKWLEYTFNRVNICTNQNETLMKQIQNSQKSIGKSIPAHGFLKSQEKNP